MAGEQTTWDELITAMRSLRPAGGARARRRGPERTAGALESGSYILASLGPPRWMERLQDIEGLRLEAEARLERAWVELAAGLRDRPEEFARRWRELAACCDFAEHNRLVAEHNDYYPVERKLRFDLRRRDYVDMWGLEWRMRPLDAAWVLEQFPPRLPDALRDQRSPGAPSGGPIVAASGPKRSA